MKTKFFYSIFCFLFLIFVPNTFGSKWVVSDGWVLKQNENLNYEKFFAIGTWGVPGYKFNRLPVREERIKYPSNQKQFLNKIKDFNLFYIQSEFGKEYMNNVMKMGGTSEFTWFLEQEYLKADENHASFYMMKRITKDINSSRLNKVLNTAIDYTLKEVKDSKDFIWAPFDEAASGVKGWSWPYSLTDAAYKEIKKRTPDKLVYIDLLGSISLLGNSFLFQEQYKKNHGVMPDFPPFYALPKNVAPKKRTLSDFSVDFYGNSIFNYKNGEPVIKEYEEHTLRTIWFENVKTTANGYKNSGDIFGINAFQYLYKYPVLAGVTVDAIKAGISKDTPVWAFFDSNGYAKPHNISIKDYLENIKCQIYTSIVHGATGVLFYSELELSDAVFNQFLPLVKELKSNLHVIYANTIKQDVSGDIHYIIKQNTIGDRYIIAVNTDTEKSIYFSNSYTTKSFFQPLEVYIGKL